MNDNFLYDLRIPPPAQFATRLKARLDLQASEGRQRRRAFRWFIVGAIMMGGTALALVSPSVRQATVAMIMHFAGASSPPEAGAPTPRATVAAPTAAAEQEVSELEAAKDFVAAPPDPAPIEAPAIASSSPRNTAALAAASGAAGGQSSLGIAGLPPRIVTIAYARAMTDVGEALVADLADGLQGLRIDARLRSDAEGLCSGDSKTVDIVISDRRLMRDQTPPCANKRTFVELPLAYDALAIVIHRENTWARALALGDLRKFGEEAGPALMPVNPVTTWSQLRSDWPTLPITLVATSLKDSAAGQRVADTLGLSGNPAVFVTAKNDRATLTLVESELGDRSLSAIGFVSFAGLTAYRRERNWPTVASIVNARREAVELTVENVQNRTYELSWPIWIYVERQRLQSLPVWQVMHSLFARQPKAIENHGLIATTPADRESALKTLDRARTHPFGD